MNPGAVRGGQGRQRRGVLRQEHAAGRKPLGPLLVVVAFAVACGALLAVHEMWRDELQAWLLARDSGSLAELWRASRYEGHPLLWHLLVMPLAHHLWSPVAMQLLHWLVATAAATVLVLRAPFSLGLRAALVLSYLPLYEYGAISRNYSLSILGVWLVCALVAAGAPPVAAAAGAALAVLASPMGMLLAPALAAAIWLVPRHRGRRLAVGLVVVAALLAALQCLPPPDYEHARGWFLAWDGRRALYVLRGFAAALLPLPEPGLHFWNSSLLFPSPLAPPPAGTIGGLGGAAVVACYAVTVSRLVRHSRRALALWVMGLTALVLFAYAKFPGTLRHAGFLWVVLVAALWLAVAEGRVRRGAAAAMLAPTQVTLLTPSANAAAVDARAPFSAARCVARALVERDLDHLPLVGANDWASSGVAAYLPGGRLFYPASGAEGSYIVWNLARTRQDHLSPAVLVAEGLARDRGQGVVVLYNAPLGVAGCTALLACGEAIVADEGLWAYRCRAPASGGETAGGG